MAEKLLDDLISELINDVSENSSKTLLEKFRVSTDFMLFSFDAPQLN